MRSISKNKLGLNDINESTLNRTLYSKGVNISKGGKIHNTQVKKAYEIVKLLSELTKNNNIAFKVVNQQQIN